MIVSLDPDLTLEVEHDTEMRRVVVSVCGDDILAEVTITETQARQLWGRLGEALRLMEKEADADD